MGRMSINTIRFTRGSENMGFVHCLVAGLCVVMGATAQDNSAGRAVSESRDFGRKAATDLLPGQEAVLRSIARGESRPWIKMTHEQAVAVHQKAEMFLENYVSDHLPQGMNADIIYTDRQRNSIVMYEGLGDGAIWTGHYLAALALKYSVEQDATTLGRIYAVFDVFERLCRMTERPGFLPRYAGPADDPAYAEYYRRYGNWDDPAPPPLGKQAFRGTGEFSGYVWLSNSTRDSYDGFLFGMAFVKAFVRDARAQEKLETIAELALSRLRDDKFWIIDGKGHVKNPVPVFTCAWTGFMLTMDPFIGLLPERNGLLSCYAPSATRSTYAETYRKTLPLCIPVEGNMTSRWETRYSSNNLTFILCAAAAVIEEAPREKALWQGMVRQMYKGYAHDHLNAHFAAIYMLALGDPKDNDARAVLQGQMIDFPRDKWRRHIDRTGDADITWHNDTQSEYALLAHERIPEDFLWQRTPCGCVGGWDMPYEYPGIDMFLPYWMGRAIGAIPGP